MKILLDTQALLWFVSGDLRMKPYVKDRIHDPNSTCFISMASLWEIAIKSSLGKLTLTHPYEEFIKKRVWDMGFERLNIESSHLVLVHSLPYHHKDPFDRLIAAQALHEQIELISSDRAFDLYGIKRIN